MTVNERNHRLERLLEVSRKLSAALELRPFLQSVIAAASELTSSEAASILEYDEASGYLRFLASHSFHHEPLKSLRIPLEGSLSGWVYRQARPLIVHDVLADPRHFKAVDQAAEFETRSLLGVPIILRGKTLGVLEAVNKTGQAHYTEEDVFILETLASQTAVAIQNVRLVEKMQTVSTETAQLSRMKSNFIAIASHELRTPLSLVIGHATFLRETLEDENQPELEIIIRSSMRLKEIVENIAHMDNMERGTARLRRRPVAISRIVRDVASSFHEDARAKRISLRTDVGTDDLTVEGDASKITIALSNLVKNAIAYTDSGGRVVIATQLVAGQVRVSVIDNGIGIPAKDLPHIFERFYQVESHLTRKHGGLGLGLSVAKAMIELHGGKIWAESVEGKGSNFTFMLPLEASRSEVAQPGT